MASKGQPGWQVGDFHCSKFPVWKQRALDVHLAAISSFLEFLKHNLLEQPLGTIRGWRCFSCSTKCGKLYSGPNKGLSQHGAPLNPFFDHNFPH